MKKSIILFLIIFFAISGCKREKEETGYRSISQEEAMDMMKRNDGHIIVDVRTQEEFDEGHIPGAVCIPNESIADSQPEELPDLSRIILVYCRSGNRSKQASAKLADMGYTNIYEFGGINTWTGEIEKSRSSVQLSFDSFDGGGMEYTAEITDPDIVSCTSEKQYYDADHEELDGAGYTVIFTLTGLKEGETTVRIKGNSPVAGNEVRIYTVAVGEDLTITAELTD